METETLRTMRFSFTLLISASLLNAAIAALPPFRSAPLSSHLLEVNAQWLTQDASPADGQAPIAFTDEAERIRMHLRMVRERLVDRRPHGLSDTQFHQRQHLLQRLGDYADGRAFPQNDALPYRNPVFIDPHGTACAVGWLMIESGHGDLARSISSGFNLGYVHEIIADARYADQVSAWAAVNGFTADELAWIQPGYPPSLPWQPFGGGANGDVTVIEKLSDGRLLVAGAFTYAGGTAANRVAVWNGTAFEALGNGVQGHVSCAIEFNGAIHLGGIMLDGNSDLARWNGSAWEFATVFDGKLPSITALHAHNGVLHAAGTVMGFVGEDHLVKRFDGAQWEQVGSGFNGRVHDLATHAGRLVAAGAFTSLDTPTMPMVLHAAELEGNEWSQLAGGLDASVHDLLSVNGTLYAAGDMINNIAPRFGLARIEAGAQAWEPLMPNLASYIFPTLSDPFISRIAEDAGRIYFGGSFIVSMSMMTIGSNIARWDGVDQVVELAYTDDAVHAVGVHEGAVVIGGAFANWQPHIASLDLSTQVSAPGARSVAVAPNPVVDAVRLSDADAITAATVVTVRDAAGREVRTPLSRHPGAVTIDAGALPSGAYTVQLDGRFAARFVKQ